MPKVCWTGWSTGATIKPHPVYDTVKGAAVGSNLPVRAAAVPAYLGVGVLQRSRQIQRPAQDAHQLRRLGRQHPRYRRLLTITRSHPLPRLSLSARSGGQGQKSPQSRTTRNQNRALKARKEQFLTTVHICRAIRFCWPCAAASSKRLQRFAADMGGWLEMSVNLAGAVRFGAVSAGQSDAGNCRH